MTLSVHVLNSSLFNPPQLVLDTSLLPLDQDRFFYQSTICVVQSNLQFSKVAFNFRMLIKLKVNQNTCMHVHTHRKECTRSKINVPYVLTDRIVFWAKHEHTNTHTCSLLG